MKSDNSSFELPVFVVFLTFSKHTHMTQYDYHTLPPKLHCESNNYTRECLHACNHCGASLTRCGNYG